MAGQRIAYKRVSSADQNTERQLEGVAFDDGQGFDEVFEDRASGKNLRRPEFEKMLRHVRRGDVVFVHSMDRLARNLADLLRTVEDLNKRGVSIRFVKENLAFDAGADASPMAKLQLQMLGAFAEFERALIRERQREGIAIAKERGKYRGRQLKPDDVAKASELRRRVASGESVVAAAKALGVSRPTAYRWLKEKAEA